MAERRRVGIVGARGYVGGELVRAIEATPHLELAFVGSRSGAGRPLAELVEGAQSPLWVEDLSPEDVRQRRVDAVLLALPNGHAAPYAEGPLGVVIDLSADFRFDSAWAYGLPERFRAHLRGVRRIANPGCYATAAQLAIAPLKDELAAPPRIFGVSGYSGAGTAPSERNDPERLRDNLVPYSLAGHLHEREISHHLPHPVHFMPHVAPFFRGITLTIDLELSAPQPEDAVRERYSECYRDEPLVHVSGAAPLVRDIAGQPEVRIGGFTSEGKRVVLVATIDNLLKGAATQALQNLNLALGFDEHLCILAENR
jgi:N-acetyl-gamma-glutamyl-phosphate reductase common form